MESKFTGGVLGNLGTNIVMGLICGITLGIGLPWAICYKQKWLAAHTIIDGKQMMFDGNGAQLFGNYIKWFLLTVITVGIYGFWLAIKLEDWKAKHTHFAN